MYTNLTISMDSDLKEKADVLFSELGMDLSTAFNLFVKESLRVGGIPFELTPNKETIEAMEEAKRMTCNGVQREHNKKLNNGLPILHKVPPKRDYGRYFCIMAEKGGTSHGGLTEKLSPFFHAKKQEVNAYGR